MPFILSVLQGDAPTSSDRLWLSSADLIHVTSIVGDSQPAATTGSSNGGSQGTLTQQAEHFAQLIEEATAAGHPKLSMAAVQGHFLVHTADPDAALQHIGELIGKR